MQSVIQKIEAKFKKPAVVDVKSGDTVKVHQKIREGAKERVQIFEGLVIARKGGTGANATFMFSKIASGVGVERIYQLHSPNIVKLEVVKEPEVLEAKLYYLRNRQDNTPRTRKIKKVIIAKR